MLTIYYVVGTKDKISCKTSTNGTNAKLHYHESDLHQFFWQKLPNEKCKIDFSVVRAKECLFLTLCKAFHQLMLHQVATNL